MKKKAILALAVFLLVGITGVAAAKGNIDRNRADRDNRSHAPSMKPAQGPWGYWNGRAAEICGRTPHGGWGNHASWKKRDMATFHASKFDRNACGRNGKAGRFENEKNRVDAWKKATRGMPDDVRAKFVELAKLKIDMRDVLSRSSLDRAKAGEIYDKMAILRQDIGKWRFERKLDDMERRQKEAELNRKVPPKPPVSVDGNAPEKPDTPKP